MPTPQCGTCRPICNMLGMCWPSSVIRCRTPYKGQPAIVFGASFVFIPAYQARTNLRDSLMFLKNAKEDSVVLVATPAKPTYSPQPRKGRYLTLLPISGNPDVDRGPLHVFAAASLPVASKEGCGGDMPVHVKMPSCFGSSKWPKTELMWEPALQRGPLWKNVHYVERNLSRRTGKGNHWKAPVPGAVDQPNWPVRKTGVHAHRSRASTAFDTSRLSS